MSVRLDAVGERYSRTAYRHRGLALPAQVDVHCNLSIHVAPAPAARQPEKPQQSGADAKLP